MKLGGEEMIHGLGKISVFLLAVVLVAGGCTPSVVYSPSINLPPEPLRQKSIQAMGGIVEMPEARPQEAKASTARGAEFTVRIGATDWMTVQGKYWKDLSDNVRADRFGISVATILAHPRDLGGFRLGLMPTAVFLGDENEWLGGGGLLPLCVWFPSWSVIHPYGAVGAGFGIRDDRNNKWGWLTIENYGWTLFFFKHFTVNAELSAVQAHDRYDKREDKFVVWSLNGGFLF